MAFSQTAILDATATRDDAQLVVAWSSSAVAGTTYQVYVNRVLAWHGTATRCVLPWPTVSPVQVDIGTVGATEATTNFAASLPAVPGGGRRASLSWLGGNYLGSTIAGFHVYGPATGTGFGSGGFGASGFGVAMTLSSPLDSITAYPQNVPADGFGMGSFGQGAFGHAASSFTWLSSPLANGGHYFAVAPYDAAGNDGAASYSYVAISAPPAPPAADSSGKRLSYAFNRGTAGGFGTGGFGAGGFGTGAGFGAGGFGVGGFGYGAGDGLPFITLSWLASPG